VDRSPRTPPDVHVRLLAVLIAVLGVVSTNRMATDILPRADFPVVSIVWQYTGMPPDEVESRIILINERVLTASVNNIEHIESQSLAGVGVIRVYFHPGAQIAEAEAPGHRHLPDAAQDHAPRHQAAVHRPVPRATQRTGRADRRVQRHADRGADPRLLPETSSSTNSVRFKGARVPQPWGGKQRQIMVDLDQDALYARGLSPRT